MSLVPQSRLSSEWHYKLCRFCNHSYPFERLSSGGPRYCPAELFSSDEHLIRNSIECLCLEPRNNLRVFQDGAEIHARELPSVTRLKLAKTLSKDNFLNALLVGLNMTWSKVLEAVVVGESLIDGPCHDLLMEGIALRDCSFIVRLCGDGSHQIHLIDFDLKDDHKLEYYLFEVSQMSQILHSFQTQINDELLR